VTLLKQARPIYFAAGIRKVQVSLRSHGTSLYFV